ncbi:unnamed protein product [Ceutorhynchus assimilis]|uniref:Elongation factor 1-delta n=1 Tax=Ceutorhynchus assimilis TaxID=467358 RepID=A0A9P0DJC3_9CUCU|nr:unnamed protein product [Ceutorhynchus assimilis]
MKDLAADIWIAKKVYDDAETAHFENQSRSGDTSVGSYDAEALSFIQRKVVDFEKAMNEVLMKLNTIDTRVSVLEKLATVAKPVVHEINVAKQPPAQQKDTKADDDDDVDLFASDSEEESEEAAKIREQRLAAYAAKKSTKPVLIAKSNIILDVKPWGDDTDMKSMEENVRKIVADGLLWGQAKLVPLAYGIKKLQISSVIEDDKVSVDWMTEEIEAIEEVQSVDIAAFNKI